MPFEVYADGIDLVIFEEFGSGAAALHLAEEVARNELMRDEDYRRRFRKDYESKYGPRVWHRDFFDAEIVACPDASVVGKSFGQVGVERGGAAPRRRVPRPGPRARHRDPLAHHDLRTTARRCCGGWRSRRGVQMGFSDAGAHLRNMAFYNFGLRLLKHVRDAEPRRTAVHDRRAGGAPPDRRAGRLVRPRRRPPARRRPGRPAGARPGDASTTSLEEYAEAPVDQYDGLSRMVNRNDATVPLVMVGGRVVFREGAPTDLLQHERTGRFLRAGRTDRAPLPRLADRKAALTSP